MKTIIIESIYMLDYNNPKSGLTIGGSQRYTLDLAELFVKKGFNVVILTKSKYEITIEYTENIKIVGLKSKFGELGNYSFSKMVFEYAKKYCPEVVVYSDLRVGYPYCYPNSVSLQHGIEWDGPNEKYKKILLKKWNARAIENYKKIICVDTNFINWSRENINEYSMNSHKFKYIPNYADEGLFKYKYKEFVEGDEIILFYPRRLVKHRGFEIFMDMCVKLVQKGYKITPLLAFEDFNYEKFLKMYPKYKELKVRIVHPKFDEISKYYYESFLSYVPTLWSEGTSLSAIESISIGCPVITSNVGGLGNIILPEYNGYILSPTVDEFVYYTEKLINNLELRNKLSKNCEIYNSVLGKKRWEKEVWKTIEDLMGTTENYE